MRIPITNEQALTIAAKFNIKDGMFTCPKCFLDGVIYTSLDQTYVDGCIHVKEELDKKEVLN